MIAFDSNVLIYFLENHPVFGPKAEDIFRQISKDGGVCSALAVTETMYGTIDTFEKITPLLSPQIKVVPLTTAIAESAGKLRSSLGVNNADAIHLATALYLEADAFITNDLNLLKKKVRGIKIRGI